MKLRQYIDPFVLAPIATQQTEDETTSYYDVAGQLLAEAYCHDGQFYSAVFYGTTEQPPITKEQAEKIVQHVQVVYQQEQLLLVSLVQTHDEFIANLKIVEPVHHVPVRDTGMTVTVSSTGFVIEVMLYDNDVNIIYPEKMISKEEARTILKGQPILKLGIAPELDWQYVYKQNYDLYGIAPDGTVRLWSEDETMQDTSFEPLPKVDPIDDFEAFLKGNRKVIIETTLTEEEKSWMMETKEQVQLEEKAFVRACKVVKHLVGNAYDDYYIEQYPTLRKLLDFEEGAYVTFRFVYIYNEISFDFQAISISVNTETNQIETVTHPFIPYETFSSLPQPTLTAKEANDIAKQLIDVELTLENDLSDSKKRSFVYLMDYPTSPTSGHIQYVDAFTGEIHWVVTEW